LSKIFFDKIPIKKPTAEEVSLFERLVPLIQFAKKRGADIPVCDSSPKSTERNVCATFLEDLIDACVMECYFREHMAERDLLFHDTVARTILSVSPSDPQTGLSVLLSLNAPSHPIRQRLDRFANSFLISARWLFQKRGDFFKDFRIFAPASINYLAIAI
jgi:adenine-specific DNA-methyltransferase